MSHIHEKIDFTITVYIVYGNKVLLRHHDKYDFWLGVGGHIERVQSSAARRDSIAQKRYQLRRFPNVRRRTMRESGQSKRFGVMLLMAWRCRGEAAARSLRPKPLLPNQEQPRGQPGSRGVRGGVARRRVAAGSGTALATRRRSTTGRRVLGERLSWGGA